MFVFFKISQKNFEKFYMKIKQIQGSKTYKKTFYHKHLRNYMNSFLIVFLENPN